jgi:hypothetical protein
MKVVRTFTLPR